MNEDEHIILYSPEEELEFYKKVNKCKTLEELADVIEHISSKSSYIQGRSRVFDGKKMSSYCRRLKKDSLPYNLLTRNFGIRQQAMHIDYYGEKK